MYIFYKYDGKALQKDQSQNHAKLRQNDFGNALCNL